MLNTELFADDAPLFITSDVPCTAVVYGEVCHDQDEDSSTRFVCLGL